MSDLVEAMTRASRNVAVLLGDAPDDLRRGTFVVRKVIEAIQAAGFVIVPREATEEMFSAYWTTQGDDRAPCEDTWSAMLAAAPQVVS